MRQLFGQADAGWVAAIISLAALLGSGIVWLLQWLNSRRKTSMDEWREIVARQDAQMAQLQKSQNECRENEIRLNRVVVYLHGRATQQSEAMRGANLPCEEVISLAQLLGDTAAAEFQARTVAQNTAIVRSEANRAINGNLPPPPAV